MMVAAYLRGLSEEQARQRLVDLRKSGTGSVKPLTPKMVKTLDKQSEDRRLNRKKN